MHTAEMNQAPMKNVFEKVLNDEAGSELVETALCVPILFLVIFGLIYFSFALYADHFVATAAKEAARYAVVRGSTWNGASCQSTSNYNCTATSADISNFVSAELPLGLSSSNLTVSSTWPGTTNAGAACDTQNGDNSPNCQVNVQVNYSFTFPLPFVNQGAIPLKSTARMTIIE
jgi:Flp pilus assembly protein TadG